MGILIDQLMNFIKIHTKGIIYRVSIHCHGQHVVEISEIRQYR